MIQYDTLDDRREIHRMLQLLHPQKMIAWLDCQCRKVETKSGARPTPSPKMASRVREAIIRGGDAQYRLATEVYFDLWAMSVQYGLDLTQATKELEMAVRSKPPIVSPSF